MLAWGSGAYSLPMTRWRIAMPYLVNEHDVVVVVSDIEREQLLKSQPQVKDEKGNVIRAGFRVATKEDLEKSDKAAKEQVRKMDKRGG